MGNFKAGSGADGAGSLTVPTPEEISLLIDGELDPVRADAVVTSLCRSDGVATWVCYHTIGDSLRGAAARGLDSKASSRCSKPSPRCSLRARRSPAPHAIALALAATVAAVSVVGWVALTTMPAPAAAIASARQAVGVRAARRPTRGRQRVSAGASGVLADQRDPGHRPLSARGLGQPAGCASVAPVARVRAARLRCGIGLRGRHACRGPGCARAGCRPSGCSARRRRRAS